MYKHKKAQGATEFIIIIAVALAVLLVLLAFNTDVLTTSNKQLQETKARTTVNDIADAAEFVYQQGVGSKTRVYGTIPEDVVNASVENRTIKIQLVGGETTFQNLDFSINGTLPTDEGSYWFCIESLENSICSIEVCPDTNATVPICGNGVKDSGEDCDGADLGSYTSDCSSHPDYVGGDLSCDDNCNYNFSECLAEEPSPECYGIRLIREGITLNFSYSNGTLTDVYVNEECNILLNNSLTGTLLSPVINWSDSSEWKNISWESSVTDMPDGENVTMQYNMTGNVLLLHLDETEAGQAPGGSDAEDTSGSSNHGNVSGGIVYGTDGKFDTAYQFDGNDGRIVFSNLMVDDFTVQMWVKTSADSSTGSECYDGDGLLWSDWGGLQVNDVGLSVLNNKLCFWSGNPDNSVIGTTEINDGEWHQIVATRDKNAGVKKLYVDGDLEVEGTTNTNSLNYNPIMELGGNNYDSNFFEGTIDEVVLYNRTLEIGEIEDQYYQGLLELNISVRSCSTEDCFGAGDFVDIDDISPQNLSLNDNEFFQLKFIFNSENLSYSPVLYNTTTQCLEADETPPGSVTGLTSPSQGETWIYWSWTNPADLDFSKAILYIDGNNTINVSTAYYNATNLDSGTNYTITVNTKDTNDNVNNSDVSDTESTVEVEVVEYRNAMVTYYDSGSSSTPRYRTWNGTDWSSQSSANNVEGSNYRWHVLESSSTREEYILATQDNSYDINVQVWDGSSWGSVLELSTDSEYRDQRNVDVAYEANSGDAMIAYLSNSDRTLPRYRTWDGNSWSSEYTDVQEVSPYGDYIRWIELESRPGSDEIIMVTMNNYWDLYAQVWDGSSWGDVQYLEGNPETVSYQNFDIACEQESPYNCMVAWSDSSSNRPRYRTWDGSSWSSESYGNSAGSSNIYWIKMAADPKSDDIALATLDSGRDLNVQIWGGSSWGSNTELDSNIETNSRKAFDLAYESNTSKLMVIYGDRNDDSPDYYTYDGSWSSSSSATNIGGDQNWVELTANPDNAEMLAVFSDNQNSDIAVQHWTGSDWEDYLEVESSSSATRKGFGICYAKN